MYSPTPGLSRQDDETACIFDTGALDQIIVGYDDDSSSFERTDQNAHARHLVSDEDVFGWGISEDFQFIGFKYGRVFLLQLLVKGFCMSRCPYLLNDGMCHDFLSL